MSSSTSTSDPRRSDLRGFVLGLVLGTIGALGVWLTAVELQAGSPYEPSRWMGEATAIKRQALARTPSPRIVAIGGSGAHFGISAAQLSVETGMPAVNTGVHAAMGLPYILAQARQNLQPGDVALVQPEYVLLGDAHPAWQPNRQLLDYVFAYDPAYVEASPARLVVYGLSLPAARIIVGLEAKLTPPAQFGHGYNSASIRTDTGDDTVNARAAMTDVEWAKVHGQLPPDFFRAPFQATPATLDELRDFAAWCAAHHVRLIVTFPPTIYVEGRYDDALVKANSDGLIAQLTALGLTVIGRPDDFRYPPDQMFDTAWHLNDVGREAHTHRLAQLMMPLLAAH